MLVKSLSHRHRDIDADKVIDYRVVSSMKLNINCALVNTRIDVSSVTDVIGGI